MTRNELKELIADIHTNAVAHGWWETERTFDDIIALCISELYEALEEDRANRPLVWYEHNEEYGEKAISTDLTKWNGEKLEGAITELADCAIRIFDYLGEVGYLDEHLNDCSGITYINEPFTKFIMRLTFDLADCWKNMNFIKTFYSLPRYANELLKLRNDITSWLCDTVGSIYAFCKTKGYNLFEIIKLKHEYNKKRPYKHGKQY